MVYRYNIKFIIPMNHSFEIQVFKKILHIELYIGVFKKNST